MARGLTIRTLGRLRRFCQKLLGTNDTLLTEGTGGVKTEIFVDDATMVLWAKSELNQTDGTPGLKVMAYEVAQEWTDMVVNFLRLQTSVKNAIIPMSAPARAALRGCQANGCTASIGPHAIDLGVDTTGGGPRITTKLRSRATSNRPRAERGMVISKTLKQVGAGAKYLNSCAPESGWTNLRSTARLRLALTPRRPQSRKATLP